MDVEINSLLIIKCESTNDNGMQFKSVVWNETNKTIDISFTCLMSSINTPQGSTVSEQSDRLFNDIFQIKKIN